MKLDANISNERNSDTFVSAIVGENNGEIINSKSVGTKITTNTVDIAGVVAVNYGKVSDCVNETELSQVSAKEWNPNVAGIAMINYGEISNSKNTGVIKCESTLAESTKSSELIVFAGGITCDNWGTISACENSADIYGKSKIILVYVGGITATCYAQQNTTSSISKSKATGNLYSETESAKTCVGGVVAYTYSLVGSNLIFGITLYSVSEINNSSFVGNIITNAKTVFAGGLVGENYYGLVNDSYASASFENTRDSSLESNYFNAGLIGGTYSYGSSFLNNNYYVNNETFSVAVNALTYYSNVINVQGLQDSACGANKIGSLDELPEELKL